MASSHRKRADILVVVLNTALPSTSTGNDGLEMAEVTSGVTK
jgi:hypothetical protein